ncbi:MAG: NgoFVII family restriction endonuclease, partial [Alphaproteobacteria bacterium]
MLISNADKPLHLALGDALDRGTDVLIASAYVSPGGAELLGLMGRSKDQRVEVSIGRAMFEGLSPKTKDYFYRLHRSARTKGGGVRVDDAFGFHSKLYCAGGIGVIGSSNMTEHGLSGWVEASMLLVPPHSDLIYEEARRLYSGGVDFDALIDTIPTALPTRKTHVVKRDAVVSIPAEPGTELQGIEISLLDDKGQVPARSGLNWGLGLGRKRDRYECYIRFPNSIHETGKYVFGSADKETVVEARTHDGRRIMLLLQGTAYKGKGLAKQISTWGDNSDLGEWMVRDCLKVPPSRAVDISDLRKYGRSTVEFYRIGMRDDHIPIVYL